jgi:hypothetical protein
MFHFGLQIAEAHDAVTKELERLDVLEGDEGNQVQKQSYY